jgi:Holliday junction resolvase RusA-like endonuclease
MKFTIPGTLSGLNEYTLKSRANKYASNQMKQINQQIVSIAIRQAKLGKVQNYPVTIKTTWYEPNNRRDADNVIFAKKFINDSLVINGILLGDGRKYVKGFIDEVLVDKENPRIEVEIKEG